VKAIVQERYGTTGVLALRDLPTPALGDQGVMVEVHAAAVNALDWHTMRGMPYLIRLSEGLRRPRHRIRGVDLAGHVVAVGPQVTTLRVGDPVFGGADGSFAELAVTTAPRLAAWPAGFSAGEAAALHVAGMTALQGLQRAAQVQPGQRILILGAGGGVGTCAVQIAKALGAHVTAVTRTESLALVRALGADEAIDHTAGDFTQGPPRFDAVFDIGGRLAFRKLRRMTARTGCIVVVGAPAGRWLSPASRMLKAAVLSPLVSQRIVPFLSANDQTSLARLAAMAAAGQVRPPIDRCFNLDEAPAAIRYVGEGRARGKVVIAVRAEARRPCV